MITDDIWTDRRVKIGYETAEELAKHYNPLNFRGHPENQRDATEESLDALGYVGQVKKSLRSGVILDGHLRIEIALAKDPAIQLPVDYYDLTPDEELLALQVLDTTTEMAEPIADKLAALMERTKHLTADKPGLAAMLAELKVRAGVNGNGNGPKDVEPQIDKAAELQKIWGTQLGQVWELGQHRLACGDCTDGAVVEAVMKGERAESLITDPPFNVREDKWDMFEADEDFIIFTSKWLSLASVITDTQICFMADKNVPQLRIAAARSNTPYRRALIWRKPPGSQFAGASLDGFWFDFEIIQVFGKPTFEPDDHTKMAVLEHRTITGQEHGCEKPSGLLNDLVGGYSQIGGIVIDFFSGTGSVLLSCENLGRKCRAIEIDPGYCAVSIQRWVDLTGQQPRLISG